MAFITEDRVLESSITAGVGALALVAALTGFRRFSAVCAVGDTVPYFIEAIDSLGAPTGDYEYGIGTYSAANTLTRTTVLGSSNGGAAVNFAAGSKNVGLTLHKAGLQTFADARVAAATPPLFNGAGLQSLAGNGYQKLPGGLILQWGVGVTNVTPGAGTVVNFPIPFPNATLSIQATNRSTSVSGLTLFAGTPALTGFTSAASAASISFSWFALGW